MEVGIIPFSAQISIEQEKGSRETLLLDAPCSAHFGNPLQGCEWCVKARNPLKRAGQEASRTGVEKYCFRVPVEQVYSSPDSGLKLQEGKKVRLGEGTVRRAPQRRTEILLGWFMITLS